MLNSSRPSFTWCCNQKFTGVTAMTSVQPKPNVNGYEFKDQDTVSLNVRVQRNF